ncbi:hypothetical protein ACJMK2_001696, partial [Sinanodonta woodiana]
MLIISFGLVVSEVGSTLPHKDPHGQWPLGPGCQCGVTARCMGMNRTHAVQELYLRTNSCD